MPPKSIAELVVRPHHTAFSCHDYVKARAFFVELLGFQVLGEMETRNEPELAEIVGMPGATCTWAMLARDGYHIELFRWKTPEGKPVELHAGARYR